MNNKCRCSLDLSLIRVCTVCLSVCILLRHFFALWPLYNFAASQENLFFGFPSRTGTNQAVLEIWDLENREIVLSMKRNKRC